MVVHLLAAADHSDEDDQGSWWPEYRGHTFADQKLTLILISEVTWLVRSYGINVQWGFHLDLPNMTWLPRR